MPMASKAEYTWDLQGKRENRPFNQTKGREANSAVLTVYLDKHKTLAPAQGVANIL